MDQLKKEDFDGHLEKPLSQMSPKEKLLYLSAQIEMRDYIRRAVKRVPKKANAGSRTGKRD